MPHPVPPDRGWRWCRWTLNYQGDVARETVALVAARSFYEQSLAAFRQLRDGWGIARAPFSPINSVLALSGTIPAIREPEAKALSAVMAARFCNGAFQSFRSAGFGRAQPLLDLRPGLLNRVEVGGIGGRHQARSGGSDEICADRSSLRARSQHGSARQSRHCSPADSVTHAEWYAEVLETDRWTLMLASQLGTPISYILRSAGFRSACHQKEAGFARRALHPSRMQECQLADLEMPNSIAVSPSPCDGNAGRSAAVGREGDLEIENACQVRDRRGDGSDCQAMKSMFCEVSCGCREVAISAAGPHDESLPSGNCEFTKR